MNELEKLWEEIQKKEDETKELRKKYFELTQSDEEKFLREKYLGKYYYHQDYNNWHTYIYVNNLEISSNTLECTEFTIIYNEKTNEVDCVRCETSHDFSCHYISKYSEDPEINKCVEITREEFIEGYELFLLHFSKTIETHI